MKRFIIKLTAIFILLLWFISPTAHADVNDFVITNFDADYTLSADDPQGLLKVHEEISVDFSDNNHGILRAIPSSYKNHKLKPIIQSVRDKVHSWPYNTYSENDNL